MTKVDCRDRFLVDEMLRHLTVLAAGAKEGKAKLAKDSITRYAVEHATELLAEAAEKVSQAFKTANPKVMWKELRPLRKGVAHPYDLGAEPVNVDQLWRFIQDDAPRIARALGNANFPEEPSVTDRRRS
jgi:uncharacterized protein with HEPN domain